MIIDVSSSLVALIPVLFGSILRFFGIIIDPPKELRARISFVEAALKESLCDSMMDIVNRIRAVATTDEVFRGDGKETPDVISFHSDNEVRNLRVILKLDQLRDQIRVGNLVLLITVLLGLVIFIANLLSSAYRLYLVAAALGIFLLQLATVISVYRIGAKLENYERLT